MPWTVYAILIVFGLFVLLMIINPRLSCFSRKISSPLYPIMRKKKQRIVQTENYGFSLVDENMNLEKPPSRKDNNHVQMNKSGGKKGKKALKTKDYGFHLGGEEDKRSRGPYDNAAGGQDK